MSSERPRYLPELSLKPWYDTSLQKVTNDFAILLGINDGSDGQKRKKVTESEKEEEEKDEQGPSKRHRVEEKTQGNLEHVNTIIITKDHYEMYDDIPSNRDKTLLLFHYEGTVLQLIPTFEDKRVGKISIEGPLSMRTIFGSFRVRLVRLNSFDDALEVRFDRFPETEREALLNGKMMFSRLYDLVVEYYGSALEDGWLARKKWSTKPLSGTHHYTNEVVPAQFANVDFSTKEYWLVDERSPRPERIKNGAMLKQHLEYTFIGDNVIAAIRPAKSSDAYSYTKGVAEKLMKKAISMNSNVQYLPELSTSMLMDVLRNMPRLMPASVSFVPSDSTTRKPVEVDKFSFTIAVFAKLCEKRYVLLNQRVPETLDSTESLVTTGTGAAIYCLATSLLEHGYVWQSRTHFTDAILSALLCAKRPYRQTIDFDTLLNFVMVIMEHKSGTLFKRTYAEKTSPEECKTEVGIWRYLSSLLSPTIFHHASTIYDSSEDEVKSKRRLEGTCSIQELVDGANCHGFQYTLSIQGYSAIKKQKQPDKAVSEVLEAMRAYNPRKDSPDLKEYFESAGQGYYEIRSHILEAIEKCIYARQKSNDSDETVIQRHLSKLHKKLFVSLRPGENDHKEEKEYDRVPEENAYTPESNGSFYWKTMATTAIGRRKLKAIRIQIKNHYIGHMVGNIAVNREKGRWDMTNNALRDSFYKTRLFSVSMDDEGAVGFHAFPNVLEKQRAVGEMRFNGEEIYDHRYDGEVSDHDFIYENTDGSNDIAKNMKESGEATYSAIGLLDRNEIEFSHPDLNPVGMLEKSRLQILLSPSYADASLEKLSYKQFLSVPKFDATFKGPDGSGTRKIGSTAPLFEVVAYLDGLDTMRDLSGLTYKDDVKGNDLLYTAFLLRSFVGRIRTITALPGTSHVQDGLKGIAVDYALLCTFLRETIPDWLMHEFRPGVFYSPLPFFVRDYLERFYKGYIASYYTQTLASFKQPSKTFPAATKKSEPWSVNLAQRVIHNGSFLNAHGLCNYDLKIADVFVGAVSELQKNGVKIGTNSMLVLDVDYGTTEYSKMFGSRFKFIPFGELFSYRFPLEHDAPTVYHASIGNINPERIHQGDISRIMKYLSHSVLVVKDPTYLLKDTESRSILSRLMACARVTLFAMRSGKLLRENFSRMREILQNSTSIPVTVSNFAPAMRDVCTWGVPQLLAEQGQDDDDEEGYDN